MAEKSLSIREWQEYAEKEIAAGKSIMEIPRPFIVCPTCGNKRCPHATDRKYACTGSNEPGQRGSAYE